MKKILHSPFSTLHSFRLRRGFFIVEAMVALSILVVGFLGIVALLSSSLGLNRQIADTYTANYLAMEGIEVVKNLIDASQIQGYPWNCGFPAGGNFEVSYYDAATGQCPENALSAIGNSNPRYLLFDPASDIYDDPLSPNAVGAPTSFQRIIAITAGTASTTVKSTVNWTTRGGGSRSVELDDIFWNWKP